MAADTPSTYSWPDLTAALLRREDLTAQQVQWAMSEVMTGSAPSIALAGFLIALRAKGETVTEVRALADVMLAHAVRVVVPGETLDIVGTGGDRSNTVNISTMSALVAAGAGVRVVKHGNRAASSTSGSADVLEALGVDLDIPAEEVGHIAEKLGITFCFATKHHPSMRFAAEARGGLRVGTAFNVLGPLTNPAQTTYAAVGAADAAMAPIIAGVFAERDRSAAVFRGDDGLDELTLTGTSTLWWVRDGEVSSHTVAPEEVGLTRAGIEALRGGDAESNAGVAREVLAGKPGPVRDAVLFNAGAALAVVGGTAGHDRDEIVQAIFAGIERAAAAIDSGAAGHVLDRWVAHTRGTSGD
ncbi:MAG: anthranilate phosphoribosyltransferase [Nostocoides sp.]